MSLACPAPAAHRRGSAGGRAVAPAFSEQRRAASGCVRRCGRRRRCAQAVLTRGRSHPAGSEGASDSGQGRRGVGPRTEREADRHTFPARQSLLERSLQSPGCRRGGFRFPRLHLRRPRCARCGGVCVAWAPPPAASRAEAGPQPGPPAARPAVSVSLTGPPGPAPRDAAPRSRAALHASPRCRGHTSLFTCPWSPGPPRVKAAGSRDRSLGPGARYSDPLLPAASAAIWTGSGSGVFEEGGVVSGKESWGFLVSPSIFLFFFLFFFFFFFWPCGLQTQGTRSWLF